MIAGTIVHEFRELLSRILHLKKKKIWGAQVLCDVIDIKKTFFFFFKQTSSLLCLAEDCC